MCMPKWNKCTKQDECPVYMVNDTNPDITGINESSGNRTNRWKIGLAACVMY